MARIQNTGKTYKMQLHDMNVSRFVCKYGTKFSREILIENIKNIAQDSNKSCFIKSIQLLDTNRGTYDRNTTDACGGLCI